MSNIITETQNRIKVKLIKVLEGFRGKDAKIEVKKLSDGTDIDTVLEEGEYLIKNATCSSGFPDLKYYYLKGATSVYVKVINSDFGNASAGDSFPTIRKTQLCVFYNTLSGSGTTGFYGMVVRIMAKGSIEGGTVYWDNIDVIKEKVIYTSGSFSSIYNPPSNFSYDNTSYFLGNFIKKSSYNPDTVYTITSLTIQNLPDSQYPIEIYFKTGSSFSGITAEQIKAWIGSTELDTNSGYKITITNLIGKIEKLTMVE